MLSVRFSSCIKSWRNGIHLLSINTNFNLKKKACNSKGFYGVVMSSEDTKILEIIQYRKSYNTQSLIYANLEFLIKIIDEWKSNSEKLLAAKVGKDNPCGYSISTIWKCNGIEKNRGVNSDEDCMKKFCISLRENATKILNFEM